MDPDVHDELQAMSGAPKVPLMSANRIHNKGDIKLVKPSRTMFSGESSGPAMNMPITTQQSNRSISPPPIPVLSMSDKATKIELEAILRKPAHTPEEKFQVLEARDKLIRLTTARNVDIKRAASAKGVCPDMCPEKERLSRESKHRVAFFELENGSKSVMNHTIAVKEYSRSSADQETPLAHELRPEPVLKITMTYMLQNIMDLCDDPDTSICDWYHFVWDRTRSIRKDITQQELCSTETVLLVEQCARFHIHCAARLVAEEPQVFDQKINTENLTKCLQSLKYIYHDLGLKRIRCPNEAEFRAYVVLLNLHDSNFLWEVKQLREEIQQSPEIQFAIKVYLALESNNYVRFFSLVRTTTYMNACILLRYFTQVRVRALQVMFKAYAPRNAVYMPISTLTYLLAFEEYEQCAQYLEYYGLTCDRDEDRVLLDRNSFYFPDIPFILDRAINIVEHKRHSSVGEAVHGCPLDSKNVLDRYEPHDSFDENGILLPKAWSADDQNYYKPEARIEARMNKTPTPTSREDESIFKMPLVPRRSSPKSRLSPKTVATTDNAGPAATNTTSASIFGSSKLTPSTQSGFFKTPTNQAPPANNIFGSFNQSTPQPNLFGNSGSTQSTTAQKPKLFDLPDGNTSTFTSSSNTAFGKMSESDAQPSNLFSKFAQRSDTGPSPFAQVKPAAQQQKPNLFGNASTNAPSIFGSFAATDSKQQANQTGFMKQPTFQVDQSAKSNLFGGFKGTSTAMPGITPLGGNDAELSKKLEREQEQAKLKEFERKKKQEEENERKKKEEMERQRQKAEEEKQKQLQRKKIEIEKAANEIVNDIIEEYVSSGLRDIAAAQIQWHRKIEEDVNRTYAELLHEVVDERLHTIALDVKTSWDKNILEKYFATWRVMARKRIEQRRKIANTPLWMPKKSMKELIPELHHPKQNKTLMDMKRYRSGLPSKLIAPPVREDSIDLWSTIAPELTKLTEQMKGRQTQHIYWKCIISIPDSDEDQSNQSIGQWLDNIFYRQLSKYPRQQDIFFAEQHDHHNQRFNVCLRKMTGKKMLNETNECAFTQNDIDGTNAILFFLSTKNLNATRERIRTTLQAIELNNATALIIYSIDSTDLNEVEKSLKLHEFMDPEKVDECIFVNMWTGRCNRNLCQITKCALKYAAANSFYNDQLEMQQSVSFLQICLADELWQRIYSSMNRNPTLLEASTRFHFLVDYHNEAIARLISVCTPSCVDATLFPFELRQFVPKHQLDIPLSLEYFPENWHMRIEEHQRRWVEFLGSLKIHGLADLEDVTNVAALERVILGFVGVHISSKFESERTAYKMIQHILAYLNPSQLNEITFKEKLAQYSWLDALPIFTTDLLSYQYQRSVNIGRLPNYVIYDKDEYLEYTRNAWWLQTNEDLLKDLTTNVLRNIDVTVDEYERNCKRQRLDETFKAAEEKQKLDDILAKGYASLASADKTLNRIKEIKHTCHDISKDLDFDLYRHEVTMRGIKEQWKHTVNE